MVVKITHHCRDGVRVSFLTCLVVLRGFHPYTFLIMVATQTVHVTFHPSLLDGTHRMLGELDPAIDI